MDLLDEDARRAFAPTDPGTGIVAALRPRDDELVWLVTGGNEAGVRRAAARSGHGGARATRSPWRRRQPGSQRLPLAGGGIVRGGLVPVYRPRPSPLHAAGAGPVTAFCGALALVCVLYGHPLVLAAVLAGGRGGGAGCRRGG